MKQNSCKWFPSVLAGLALAASSSLSQAQTAVNPNTFDTGKGSWIIWNGWGLQGWPLDLDPTLDAGNDPSSGSLRYEIPFVGGSSEQYMTFGTLGNGWGWDSRVQINAIGYTNIAFDFRLDPSSFKNKSGNYGSMDVGLVTTGWKTSKQGTYTIPASATSWTHVTIPIVQTTVDLDKVVGVYFGAWSGGSYTNTLIFNIDNVLIQPPPTNAPPVPPPTMKISKAGTSGVAIIMDDDTAQWQRNAISTPAGSGPYMWTAQGKYPVEYSLTITNFPDATNHAGFEAHLYIVNQDTSNGQETSGSPDWGVPDLFILRIENLAAGNVRAQLQWKTNYPNANATNVPVSVTGPTAIGTWTLTFTDSSNGTLAGPGITATNFSLPADVVASNFSPVTSFLQFGMFKNDGPNDGHNNGMSGTFSQVKFTGAAAPFVDDFSGATLTNKYAWRKTSATAVQYVPPGTAWQVDWSMPAAGFSAQTAPAVTGPWTNAVFSSTYTGGGKTHALVSQAALPVGNAGFFRMIKRPFEKLQVLMPGETAAPNTPSGKTGTPTPQTAGLPFNVTVNAVDAVWNRVSSTDTIAITSSDSTAALPANAALVGGTATFSVTFLTTGNYTVTATDVTDATKTANTGSTTAANP